MHVQEMNPRKPAARAGALPTTLSLLASIAFAGSVHADISGFNSGTGWSSNGSPLPGPVFSASAVTLTNTGVENDAGSVFFNTRHDVGLGFSAQFTYQQTSTADPGSPGDGIAFVVQNSANGAGALGFGGGSIGYEGIGNSLAVVLDLNQGSPRRNTTGLGFGGNYNDNAGFVTAPLSLESGHQIRVDLNYNAGSSNLVVTLTDLTTSAVFTHTYTGINLNTLLGGNGAWVGFTGATGQFDNTQVVSGFTLTAAPSPTAANWNVLATGAWFNSGNWTPSGVPTAALVANIANGGTCTFAVEQFGQAASVNLRGGSTMDLRGTLTSGGPIRVGESGGTGLLTVRDGGIVNAPSIVVGADAGTAGTLRIGNGGAPGTLNAPVSSVGPGLVRFNHNSSFHTFAQPLSGPLSVVHDAGTTTLLSSAITYRGATTINGGTLRIADNFNFDSPISIAAGGALVLDISLDVRLLRNLSGAGPVTVAGNTRTARLGGNNAAYSGTFSLPVGTRGMMWGIGASGSAAARWDLSGQFALIQTVPAATVRLGALSGSNAATELSTFSGTGLKTFEVGALGTNTTFAGVIRDNSTFGGGGTNTVALSKVGGGTLTLSNTNTYTGGTSVNAGTLRVNGSIGGSLSVASGATIGGSGTVNGAVAIQPGGSVAPGASPGRLTFGGPVTLDGTLRIDLNGPVPASGYDQLMITSGDVSLLSSANLAFETLSGVFSVSDQLIILNNAGAGTLSGSFAGLPDGGANGTPVPALSGLGGFSEWRIYYSADEATGSLTGGNDIALAPVDDAPCAGDVNGDDEVNLSDLAILLANFGTASGAALEDGDMDGDGDVDLSDLSQLLGAFGTTC
ncbi:MAG: autotransporter-associated beta strand repeat-containing protein [Phycisphaerae bacterium]